MDEGRARGEVREIVVWNGYGDASAEPVTPQAIERVNDLDAPVISKTIHHLMSS